MHCVVNSRRVTFDRLSTIHMHNQGYKFWTAITTFLFLTLLPVCLSKVNNAEFSTVTSLSLESKHYKKPIVIFGATGNTGLVATEYAVKTGLMPKVFVRDVNKIPFNLRDKVIPIVGDVKNAEQVSSAIFNTSGVAVALGTRTNFNATTVFSEGMKNIIAGMKKHKVEAVSVVMSSNLFRKHKEVIGIFKNLDADRRKSFDILKKSGLKWIAIFSPQITNVPGSKYVIKENASPGKKISKYNLAEFLVTSLEKPELYQKVWGIANV